MIYITGDTHGGFQRFNTKNFPQQKLMGRSDYAIITGDFGGVWDDSPREAYWLDWLEEKPFTTLFVDGNHENFDRLGELPVHQWQGGKVHYVRPHVLHLMRGQVFEIDGITFFAMGGAASHDIQDGILDPASPGFEQEYWFKRRTRQMFRVKGISWWPQEMPSEEEPGKDQLEGGLRPDPLRPHQHPAEAGSKLHPGPADGLPPDGQAAVPIRLLVPGPLPPKLCVR